MKSYRAIYCIDGNGQNLIMHKFIGMQSRWGIFTDLNSVEIHRNRIFLGGPIFAGPRMSENTLSALFQHALYEYYRNKRGCKDFPDYDCNALNAAGMVWIISDAIRE
jgi:hypothetical protein